MSTSSFVQVPGWYSAPSDSAVMVSPGAVASRRMGAVVPVVDPPPLVYVHAYEAYGWSSSIVTPAQSPDVGIWIEPRSSTANVTPMSLVYQSSEPSVPVTVGVTDAGALVSFTVSRPWEKTKS